MFIEVAEVLRCPREHDQVMCVVRADEIVGRTVIRGVIGCPRCNAEYPIDAGVADFAPLSAPDDAPSDVSVSADAPAVGALLGIAGPGGYVVLAGSASRLGVGLASLFGGIHFLALNAPDDVAASPSLTLLHGSHPFPLRTSTARGVVVGEEYAIEPWLSDAARLVLDGLRMVVLTTKPEHHPVAQLACGDGLWVGQKTVQDGRLESC